ncbi:MAG: hypothetical protein ACLR43_02045 [Faecalibacillus faecis]
MYYYVISSYVNNYVIISKRKEASIEYQGVWTDYAAKEYVAGDGTKESPYLIKDASELALLAKMLMKRKKR